MPILTKRQKQIFDFISEYINKHKVSPTFEEIGKRFKLKAPSTIHQHIETLVEKGYLNKNENSRGVEVKKSVEDFISVPLAGTIAAGQPIEAVEEKETIAIPKINLPFGKEIFALKVVGDSMIQENINDGDIILAKKQPYASNGDRVIALIDNSEATLKKFFIENNQIRLQPANAKYKSLLVKPKDLIIQGVVIDVIKNITTKLLEEKKIIEQYKKLPLNQIICGDAVKELRKFPNNSVDLVVTSPPYDGIRKYNGFSFDLHATGKEIYRVLKEGGIAVMVIQDQTKNFGKSLTSFRTIVDWVDNIGFKLFETVIYRKHGTEGAWWKYRFRVDHEYMPIFLKGEKPKYFDKEPLKVPSKHGGKIMTGSGNRRTDGTTTKTVTRPINPMKCRGTIWNYLMAGDKDELKRKHPAVFPDKIPLDFIQCFCPPDGIVLDPFIGCGSTAVAAKHLKRNYMGIDISEEYCNLAKERIRRTPETLL